MARDRDRERSSRRRSRSRSRSRDRDRHRRERSSSRDRKHRRHGSPSRRRHKDRDRDRRSPDRKRHRSRSPKSKRSKREKSKSPVDKERQNLLKDLEQKKLDVEMQKRRERIEKWRQQHRKNKPAATEEVAAGKVWSLDDEASDSDEGGGGEEEIQLTEEEKAEAAAQDAAEEAAEEEEDPLDQFMEGIKEEVSQYKGNKAAPDSASGEVATTSTDAASVNGSANAAPGGGTKVQELTKSDSKVTVITAVATRKLPENSDQRALEKGEVIEQNQDALEYSSEEEDDDQDILSMTTLNKKKRELNQVDHTKVYYRPFKKDFYIEVSEIATMTTEEVDKFRKDQEGIKIRGKKCPKPIRNWAQCGVSKRVMETLKKNGFEKPTPIQCQAIPVIMSGRDMIGIAKTGSGKTLAFLLPMFRHIVDQPELDEGDGPIAVIMTPTRELALQITRECKKFTKYVQLRAVCVYGGTGISEQIAELKRGAEIVVCTPGRMIDMLAANSGRVTNLRRCTYVVLDEADRMFDLGFEPQVTRIVENVRPDRQTIMFSATFPRSMEALARRVLTRPIEVQVGGRSVVCSDVEQNIVVLEEYQKFLKLLELLGLFQERGSILIFVDKQEHADELMQSLNLKGHACQALHGGVDQYDRDSVITDFKRGDIQILVATSVAARGLDVQNLILVVNYDCPNHYEDYVHRVGRTGRAGNKGYAYTFMIQDNARHAGDIIRALELSGCTPPDRLVTMWDNYVAEQEAQGRKVKSHGGFGGQGFKFDENEAVLAKDRKKIQKQALGLQDSDEENAGVDIEQKIDEMFEAKREVRRVSRPLGGRKSEPQGPSQSEMLDKAKRIALKINKQRNIGSGALDETQEAAKAILSGGMASAQISSDTVAKQIADKINQKLGYTPLAAGDSRTRQQQEDDEALQVQQVEETLSINDFPQSVRWRVTARSVLNQVQDFSEASITVRGTYIAPGKEPRDGEERLHLHIEALTELSIQKAKAEVTRVIKEEMVRLQNSYQSVNKGRYKVL